MLVMVVFRQAHVAIAECESRLKQQGRRVVVITQNIDTLHARAGSTNIIELHGTFLGLTPMSHDPSSLSKLLVPESRTSSLEAIVHVLFCPSF